MEVAKFLINFMTKLYGVNSTVKWFFLSSITNIERQQVQLQTIEKHLDCCIVVAAAHKQTAWKPLAFPFRF